MEWFSIYRITDGQKLKVQDVYNDELRALQIASRLQARDSSATYTVEPTPEGEAVPGVTDRASSL